MASCPRKICLLVLILLLYLLLNIFGLIYHEPWRDEAQSWLVAREANLVKIFAISHYEAAPVTWHLLLAPFAKSGLPYITQSILNLAIAFFAITIFLVFSPFSLSTKILFIFSYYLAFEYSVIGRHYALSILLIFLIAAFYPKRFKHALIYAFLVFLLFNINVFSFSFAASLCFIFAWELFRKKIPYPINSKSSLMGLCIMVAGGCLAILQVYPYGDSIYSLFSNVYSSFFLAAPLISIKNALFPFGDNRSGFIILALACMTILIFPLFKSPQGLSVILISYAGLFMIFMLHMRGELRYDGFLLIILMVAIWISSYYDAAEGKLSKKIQFMILKSCLLLSVIYCIHVYSLEYRYYFSGAKEMATFIRQHNLDLHAVVAQNGPSSSALLPYLKDSKFWYAGQKEYASYVYFTKHNFIANRISVHEAVKEMKLAFPGRKDILLLLIAPLVGREAEEFELVHRTNKKVFRIDDEVFYLYRYKNFPTSGNFIEN